MVIEPQDVTPVAPVEEATAKETPEKETPAVEKPVEKVIRPVETTPPAPRKVLVKEYEIQVGSYEHQYRAEAVNQSLKEYGLSGMIRTRDVGSDTFFRVRIGPYTDHREAEKFLGWIQKIDCLEESYISQVSRTREVQ